MSRAWCLQQDADACMMNLSILVVSSSAFPFGYFYLMLPFITRWELSQESQSCTVKWENMKRRITIALATWYSWPNFQVLHPGVGGEPSNFLTFLFYYSIYMHLPYIRTDVLCKGTVFSNFTLNWFLPESYKEYINIFIGGTTATQLSQLLISAHGERTTFYNVKWNVSWFFSMHF